MTNETSGANPENSQLRSELAKLREDVQDDRAHRAERVAQFARDWMSFMGVWVTLATIVVTIALGVFTYLGYSTYKDITDKQSKVSRLAEGARHDATKVAESAKHASDLEAKIESVYIDVQNLRQSVGKGIANKPYITRAARAGVEGKQLAAGVTFQALLHGTNFGPSPGHIYGYAQTAALGQLSDQVEIARSSILKWTDTDIVFFLSSADYAALEKARVGLGGSQPTTVVSNANSQTWVSGAFITFRVESHYGASSELSPALTWPWPLAR